MSLRSFTYHDLVERNALLHGAHRAFAFGSQNCTHAHYAERSAQLAAGLASVGVSVGERVAILAHNSLEYAQLFGAAARLGAIVVPINWRLSAEEVAYVISDVAPRVLIVSPELRALVPADLPTNLKIYTLAMKTDGAWPPFAGLYLDATVPAAEIGDEAPFVIIHTAAVGGRPRGAVLTHSGLISAAVQSQLLWRLTTDDVGLGVLPLFHLAGVGLMLALQAAGGATVLLPRFDPQALVGFIDGEGGSVIGTFPPMLGALLDAATQAGSTLKPLRVVTGIDVPDTIARFGKVCPQADFWVAYGQTETSGSVTLGRFSERAGSAGRPTPLTKVAIVDEMDGPLPAGSVGEIVVRGPMVFAGYWRCDEDNALTFRQGWHHTGDMGRLDDDGYLWYSGRSPAKELIKPGGENVYPAEVERALLEHPALAAAVVFGVPDADWGEAVKAVCVLKDGQRVQADALIEFVGQRIARYKKPKHVVFVSALPTGPSGAPDRAALKAAHGAA